jgi:chromosome segregation ATPase
MQLRETELVAAEEAIENTKLQIERERTEFAAQSAEVESQLAHLKQRLSELELENDELRRRPVGSPADGGQQEVSTLQAELEEAKQSLSDLQRKHQMALDDLRAQRTRIAELEKSTVSGPAPRGDHLDWEARKRLLLATLEADDAGEAAYTTDDRRRIEDLVHGTERALELKDQEIAELRQLLEAQSSQIGGLALGAQAVAAALDNDEIVQQERAKLNALQAEWEEKLRMAEIDLSLERARIARERVEVEEKLRQLEQQMSQAASFAGASGCEGSKEPKPARGRWLARLGLKEDEQ